VRSVTYLDSSAIVKVVVREPESAALRRCLRRRRPLLSSTLARAEVLRALQPAGDSAVGRGREMLARIDLVRVNDRVLSQAGTMKPAALRTLDAIHLTTAGLLGAELRTVVTYDDRMADAAKRLGHRVASPR
jgi:predicted nucleic acid-binding protein